jgi:transcriptional regulator with XRE-family HTH domain
MDNELLVKSIREICKSNNITPSQLEAELGFGAGLISRWTKSSPSLDKIVDIADYFNVSIDELIGRNQKTSESNNFQFVYSLIQMTKNGYVKWKNSCLMCDINENYKTIIDIDYSIKNFNDYPRDNRRIDSFVLEYDNGFITLESSIIINHNSIQQYDGQLFIQPDENTEPVYQECDQTQLLELYKTIKRSYGNKIPEDLAENFKEKLYNEQNIKSLQEFRRDLNNVNIPTTQDIDNMFSNDGVINAIVKLNDPSIKSIVDTFTNPQMIKMINSVSRMQSYMKKISDKEKNNDD